LPPPCKALVATALEARDLVVGNIGDIVALIWSNHYCWFRTGSFCGGVDCNKVIVKMGSLRLCRWSWFLQLQEWLYHALQYGRFVRRRIITGFYKRKEMTSP